MEKIARKLKTFRIGPQIAMDDTIFLHGMQCKMLRDGGR